MMISMKAMFTPIAMRQPAAVRGLSGRSRAEPPPCGAAITGTGCQTDPALAAASEEPSLWETGVIEIVGTPL